MKNKAALPLCLLALAFLHARAGDAPAATTTPAISPSPASATATPAPGILVKDGEKIAFLGDSITANGWNQPGGYVRLVVDALAREGIKVTPIPAGVSGNTSRDMLARLQTDVLDKQPGWMTLSCGVNDVWHGAKGVDLDTYKQNVAAILDRAQAKGIKVVLLTSTPIGEEDNDNNRQLAPYNDFLRQAAKERSLPLADLGAAFHDALGAAPRTAASRDLTVDGVHMNPGGNLLMAEGCLRALGIPGADLTKIETAWLTQPGTAFLPLSAPPVESGPAIPITLGQYRALLIAAQKQKTDVLHIATTLWLKALAAAVQSRDKDDVLDPAAIRKEATALLIEKIAELPKQ